LKVGEICLERGISDQTFYNGETENGGMTVSDVRRVNGLETDGKQQLTKLLAVQALPSIQALKKVLEKKPGVLPAEGMLLRQ